jgi:DNA-binding MarR family transcriptional regulator
LRKQFLLQVLTSQIIGYAVPVTEGPAAIAIWRNLHLADAVVCEKLNARLAERPGCSLTEHDLLAWLAAAPQHRLRMLDLAARLRVSPGGLTRIIDRLADRGWVQRHRPAGNRREVYVTLTGIGRTARRAAQLAYSQVIEQSIAAVLDEQDLLALGGITHKLLVSLGPGQPCQSPLPPGSTGEPPRRADDKAGRDAKIVS